MRRSKNHLECVHTGVSCVQHSWAVLDIVRAAYQEKVREDEKLLLQVAARLWKRKEILRQANKTARRKAECLACELKALGERVWVSEQLTSHQSGS